MGWCIMFCACCMTFQCSSTVKTTLMQTPTARWHHRNMTSDVESDVRPERKRKSISYIICLILIFEISGKLLEINLYLCCVQFIRGHRAELCDSAHLLTLLSGSDVRSLWRATIRRCNHMQQRSRSTAIHGVSLVLFQRSYDMRHFSFSIKIISYIFIHCISLTCNCFLVYFEIQGSKSQVHHNTCLLGDEYDIE